MCLDILLALLKFKDCKLEVDDNTADAVLEKMNDIFIHEKAKVLFTEIKQIVLSMRELLGIVAKPEYTDTVELIIHKYLLQSVTDAALRLGSIFSFLMKLDPEHEEAAKKVGELIQGLNQQVFKFSDDFNKGLAEWEKLKNKQ